MVFAVVIFAAMRHHRECSVMTVGETVYLSSFVSDSEGYIAVRT